MGFFSNFFRRNCLPLDSMDPATKFTLHRDCPAVKSGLMRPDQMVMSRRIEVISYLGGGAYFFVCIDDKNRKSQFVATDDGTKCKSGIQIQPKYILRHGAPNA